MKKEDLAEMTAEIMAETVKRRQLGGFDANAETILKMIQWQLKMAQHLEDMAPKK